MQADLRFRVALKLSADRDKPTERRYSVNLCLRSYGCTSLEAISEREP